MARASVAVVRRVHAHSAESPVNPTRPLAVAALVALAVIAPRASGEDADRPFFMALPPKVLGVDVGANGWVTVGVVFEGTAFYWMPTTGTTNIGGTQAVAVSRDGTTIAGRALNAQGREEAAVWTSATSWRLLGSFTRDAQPCDMLLSGAFGASDDGKVIVGLGWNGCSFARAFRWEESTGMVDLGTLSGSSTRANNVSGDGQVVVGWETDRTGFRRAAKWVRGTEQLINAANGGMIGEARAANRDGSLIVGTNCDPERTTGPTTAWTWTAEQGVRCFPVERPQTLPALPYQTLMLTTSDDGRVIAGSFSFGLDAEALIWLDGQPHFLKDYLRNNGLPDAFRGWINTGFILGMTADGRTLVGYGAGPTTFTGYMVVLPRRR
jgi:probable HAF family extracellular repeat protein